MDSEIVFGQVEYQPPERAVRPDRNRQFCVCPCGTVNENDLPIFVDLDVMRDMEAHARINTHVELGGVLLGGQYVDSNGESFVVVREALRAEHYEATRGSFKFTHDTWAQITRDREQFPKDLQLVGWYHTHPDWGVFLSGMDMFICEHFFNSQLDLALVIDPCRGDRGWFYWQDDDERRQKKQAGSFYLMANRFRETELAQFASMLSQTDPDYLDPRYNTLSGDFAVQPVVHFHDQRTPLQTIAILGMLTIQLLVVALIAYRVLLPPPTNETASNQQQSSERLHREILGHLVKQQQGEEGNLIDHFENVQQTNREMGINMEAQMVMIEQMKRDQANLETKLKGFETRLDKANSTIAEKNEKIEELNTTVSQQEGQLEKAGLQPTFWNRSITWPLAAGLALLTAVIGIFASHLYHRGRMLDEFESEADLSHLEGDGNRGKRSDQPAVDEEHA